MSGRRPPQRPRSRGDVAIDVAIGLVLLAVVAFAVWADFARS